MTVHPKFLWKKRWHCIYSAHNIKIFINDYFSDIDVDGKANKVLYETGGLCYYGNGMHVRYGNFRHQKLKYTKDALVLA